MSLVHGFYGFWRTTGGSTCCTCYIQSWLCPQKASCRNTSPGPTSRRLKRQHTAFGITAVSLSRWSLLLYKDLPESTIMSSSSPEPSSSLNTTCFPCRNTVRFPENPSTFCTFITPSSRSRPSQEWCSSLGSSLQEEGLGRHVGWRGMLMSSSGSSLIIRPPKDSEGCASGSAEWAGCALLSSKE